MPLSKPVLILGGGGHASVLVDALKLNSIDIIGVVDPVLEKGSTVFNDVLVLGNEESVSQYNSSELLLVNGLGPSPKRSNREDLNRKFLDLGYEFCSVIHPSALISPNVKLKMGVQVMAGAVIQSGCEIGFNTVVNTGAIVDHDCILGDYCHLAPGAILCGGVETGSYVFIGTGAKIIENLLLEDRSLVAAGATLRKNLKENQVFYG